MSLKEHSKSNTGLVNSYLIAISIVGISGLSLMLGGAIALKNGAQFDEDMIGVFMLMTFFMIAFVEFFLCRQLSRISRSAEKQQQLMPPLQTAVPAEFRQPQPRALAEPLPSVTENTTRTLQYSRNEPSS